MKNTFLPLQYRRSFCATVIAACVCVACSSKSMQFSSAPAAAPQNMASSAVNRIMPRNFLATSLNQVFGPSINAVTAAMISPVANDFLLGGPCDNNGTDCPSVLTEDSQAPMIPATTSGRESVMTRTCDLIVDTDSAVRYAVAQVRNDSLTANFTEPTDADTIPPSAQDLLGAYDLFYPGKTPDPSVVASLQAVGQEAYAQAEQDGVTPALDEWRFTLLTLCIAPDWQAP
jgi:hypothetical protein